MKKLKFLKIFLISFAVFCTISIGAVSSYLFFKNIASNSVSADTWENVVKTSIDNGTFSKPSQIENSNSSFNGYYQISTASELAWVSYMVNDNNSNYGNINVILTKNIDLSGHNWVPIGIYNGGNALFNGTFDGQGFEIKSMKVDGNYAYAGLFGYVAAAACIKNVKIIDATVNSTLYAGVVAGYSNYYYGSATFNNIMVINSKAITTSQSTSYAGGVVGFKKYGKIENCFVINDNGEAKICAYTVYEQNNTSPPSYMGGIVGYGTSGLTIQYCFNNALIGDENVDSEQNSTIAGGIAGCLDNSTIDQCYNTGVISANSFIESYSGGICGFQVGGKITNCYNTGEVKVAKAGVDSPNWYEQDEFKDNCYKLTSGIGETCYVYKSNDLFEKFTKSYDVSPYQTMYLFATPALDNAGQGYEVFITKAACHYQNGKGYNYSQPIIIKKNKGRTGGISAYARNAEIINCYNMGKINTTNCNFSRHYQLGYILFREHPSRFTNKVLCDVGYAYNNATATGGVVLDFEFDYEINSGEICGELTDTTTCVNNYADSNVLLNLRWSQKLVYGKNYYSNNRDAFFYDYIDSRYRLTNSTGWSVLKHEEVDCEISSKIYGYNVEDDIVEYHINKWESKRAIISEQEANTNTLDWDCYFFKSQIYWGGDTFNTYLTFDLTNISSIKFYAQKYWTENDTVKHIGDPMCYETITTGIDLTKYGTKEFNIDYKDMMFDDKSKTYTEVYKKETGCTIASSISASDLDSDYWAVDSTGVINGGMPYLKALYW